MSFVIAVLGIPVSSLYVCCLRQPPSRTVEWGEIADRPATYSLGKSGIALLAEENICRA
ncbi:hypothetical protein F2Q69_00025350 [Brassica cretica]|uniref:Uncharacterized protein n=1 Tax=Brassica cretica TaxID=69181 RepID=A0A8S9QPW9_BRACR|nr:hypothetical protein F2Q69_00025350 [Brassica cretica]